MFREPGGCMLQTICCTPGCPALFSQCWSSSLVLQLVQCHYCLLVSPIEQALFVPLASR